MALTYVLLAVSFAMLLAGAFVFTNAVEWAGLRLNLGHGAVGSILAAVATALPESVIPVVAVITGGMSGNIAIGAIIGAPFLLGTLAMFLVGLSAIIFRSRREQGVQLRLHRETTMRDLMVFLIFLGLTLVLGILGIGILNIIAAILFVVAYGVYVWRTIRAGQGSSEGGEELSDLFFDPSKQDPPRNFQIVLQVLFGLALIIYGAHLFVKEIEHIATSMGISALLLALVLAPLASELPEKANSFIWVRTAKDSLALGNITGAMVFQSMMPVAFGLLFTSWEFGSALIVVTAAALLGGALAILAIRKFDRFAPPFMAAWALLYVGAVAYIIVGG